MSTTLEDMVSALQKMMEAENEKSADVQALIEKLREEAEKITQDTGKEGATLPKA